MQQYQPFIPQDVESCSEIMYDSLKSPYQEASNCPAHQLIRLLAQPNRKSDTLALLDTGRADYYLLGLFRPSQGTSVEGSDFTNI